MPQIFRQDNRLHMALPLSASGSLELICIPWSRGSGAEPSHDLQQTRGLLSKHMQTQPFPLISADPRYRQPWAKPGWQKLWTLLGSVSILVYKLIFLDIQINLTCSLALWSLKDVFFSLCCTCARSLERRKTEECNGHSTRTVLSHLCCSSSEADAKSLCCVQVVSECLRVSLPKKEAER